MPARWYTSVLLAALGSCVLLRVCVQGSLGVPSSTDERRHHDGRTVSRMLSLIGEGAEGRVSGAGDDWEASSSPACSSEAEDCRHNDSQVRPLVGHW